MYNCRKNGFHLMLHMHHHFLNVGLRGPHLAKRGRRSCVEFTAMKDLRLHFWVLRRGQKSPFDLQEQSGPHHTSSNHPSVTIVCEKHMWLFWLFIRMRMKIRSFWLLPHKQCWMKCCVRQGTFRSVCAQQAHFTKKREIKTIMSFQSWDFNKAGFVSWHIETKRRKKQKYIRVQILVELQKWLDHLTSSFLCFYFLQHRTFPKGVHNHNGFPEISSTRPDAEGAYYCNNTFTCVWVIHNFKMWPSVRGK